MLNRFMRAACAMLAFVSHVALAQFVPGQVLTAQQLNSALSGIAANALPISGGALSGPLTAPAISVSGAANLSAANVTGGAVDGTAIGARTPGTGAFTTLTSRSIAVALHVPTNAALGVTAGFAGATVTTDGYYASGDRGGANYAWGAASCTLNSGAGDAGSQVPSAGGGCWNLADKQLNVLAFGAYPNFTNAAATTTAFQNWWTACMAPRASSYGGTGGNDCFMPAGHYALNSLTWDFVTNPGGGAYIHGAGANSTTLDFSGTPGAYLYTHNSGNDGWYYAKFENFGVYAANTTIADKAAWQIGPTPTASASDAANGVTIDHVYVGNLTGCLAGTKGLSVNNFYAGIINAMVYNFGCTLNSSDVSTSPSGGDALYLNGVAYSTIRGSASHTTTGIHVTASSVAYTQQNTFINVALENVFTDILIDSPYVRNNTFIGGQYVWCTTATSCPSGTNGYAINATAGYSNVFINPNLTINTNITSAGACSNGVLMIAGGGPFGTDNCTALWNLTSPNGTFQVALSGPTAYLTNNASGSIHLGVASGNSVAVDVNGANVANFGYWGNGYQNAAPVAISALPTCNSSSVGTMAWVNNGVASPTYRQAVSSSSTGSAVVPTYCTYSGSAYSWSY